MKRQITILFAMLLLATTVAGQTPVTLNCTADGGTNCSALIPDGFGSLTSTITVAPGDCTGTVQGVTVPLSITHDWVGDLNISLFHTGTATLLLPSSCSRDDIDATFADGGLAAGCSLTAPAIGGTVAPASALSTFDGQSGAGAWTLTVQDTSNGGIGALNDWTLAFTCVPIPVVTVAATDTTATEGADTGSLTFTRTGPTTSPLVVNYTLGGTASAADYTPPLVGTVTIPTGSASVTITISALMDALLEPTETIVVTLDSGSYTIGVPDTATVSILNAILAAVPVASPGGLLLLALLLGAMGMFVIARVGR